MGTRLIVPADAPTLGILNDKALFYREAELLGVKIPRFRVAQSLEEFEEAVGDLAGQGREVCFKPAKSLYGLGFKAIREPADPLKAFLAGDSASVSLGEARSRLAVPAERFVKLVVMERLPGPEWSVDCLAQGGRLLRATVRKKSPWPGRPERLVEDGEVYSLAERRTSHFKLSWVFNVQAIDSEEGPKILEINPRMAGGLYFSCLAGINYPYWALRLALGPCESLLPDQAFGLSVSQFCQPFVYEP
jgi:predicted ATP-grasp superfamily ATP-dependent carboligase